MEMLAALPVRLALPLALAASPYLAVRLIWPTARNAPLVLAAAGAAAVALCSALAVGLHAARLPITPASLAAAHWLAFALLAGLAAWRRPPLRLALASPAAHRLLWLAAAFAVLVLPLTHLAGIDTYKWQDLATGVRVERRIAWLVHPLSLLGFTPRAYPSGQPLTLATIQMLGGLGVEWGYYAMSLLSGWIGITAAASLGGRVCARPGQDAWFAGLYAFSPVFVRYNHWATGRGLFLAILPLFLWSLLELPRRRALVPATAAAALLLLSHKAGLVAVGLITASLAFAALLPRTDRRWLLATLLVPFVVLALLISPSAGGPVSLSVITGFARQCLTRFGWYVPAAGVGLLLAGGWFALPARRRLVPAALLTFPLAFHREMYGALLALPFVALAAAEGAFWLARIRPTWARAVQWAVAVLTAAAALTVVVHRSRDALRPAVCRAALFLEAYDPAGPLRVEAPDDLTRGRIQAYLSGCPRFEAHAPAESRVTFARPPPLRGPPRARAQEWINYLRSFAGVADAGTDWYGKSPRVYQVAVAAEGRPPPGAKLLYDRDGVRVFAPVGQDTP
jgi:hypothetical protein